MCHHDNRAKRSRGRTGAAHVSRPSTFIRKHVPLPKAASTASRASPGVHPSATASSASRECGMTSRGGRAAAARGQEITPCARLCPQASTLRRAAARRQLVARMTSSARRRSTGGCLRAQKARRPPQRMQTLLTRGVHACAVGCGRPHARLARPSLPERPARGTRGRGFDARSRKRARKKEKTRASNTRFAPRDTFAASRAAKTAPGGGSEQRVMVRSRGQSALRCSTCNRPVVAMSRRIVRVSARKQGRARPLGKAVVHQRATSAAFARAARSRRGELPPLRRGHLITRVRVCVRVRRVRVRVRRVRVRVRCACAARELRVRCACDARARACIALLLFFVVGRRRPRKRERERERI